MKTRLFVAVMALAFAGAASATPGGLDKKGCHKPKDGAYHCHTKKEVKAWGIGAKDVNPNAPTDLKKLGPSEGSK